MDNKLKIAFLLVGYNCHENLNTILAPFVRLKYGIKDEIGCTVIPAPNDIEVKICCVSALFSEYWDLGFKYDNDKTANLFRIHEESQAVDKFIEIKEPVADFKARDAGLQWLKQWDFDYLWQWDCDEFGQYNELINAINWIKRNNLYSFYRINYKNYFGRLEDKTYLLDFSPVRIINNRHFGGIDKMRFDNDVFFQNGNSTPNCAGITIPRSIISPIHPSWVFKNKEDAINKIKYQQLSLPGSVCSYIWDEKEDRLKLNIDGYYNKLGILVPEIYKDKHE